MEKFFNSWMVFSDPPNQTKLRESVTSAFTRRVADSWSGYAREIAVKEFARLGSGEIDLADLSLRIASRFTCAVLGVPEEDDEQVRLWSNELIACLSTPKLNADRARVGVRAIEQLGTYLDTRVLPRIRKPVDDRLLPLKGMADLDHDMALALFTQLLTGGIDPVASSLTTALERLLSSDHQDWTRMASSPELTDKAVEEALRFDAPFHFVPRTTTESIQIGDHTLSEGSRVVLVIAAANRDPLAYQSPDEFIPSREGPSHLSFGLGRHYCLGAILARMVLREALQEASRWVQSSSPMYMSGERMPAFGVSTWKRLSILV
ncbi:cytochrome P450 [Streptomyces beijiangensis]|uniref:Cytochrome P450 n=1 Tax=Streptomyces beijiangensis TaxID=163361 RepID=A0A939JKL5_9ACTN|nr:cytochrome P450 [Streptomyces beijiangensis]MBO0514804.1 cytochrome P450 [Streptomyces beijiangensis]